MVDKRKITALIDKVMEYVSKLKKLSALKEDEFLSDFTKTESTKHCLQNAIEACLDIANHIISRYGFRAPKDYVDAFKVLGENGVIDNSFFPTLAKMARMRNRIVHLYWQIDDKEIYRVITTNLGDFDIYIKAVAQFIGKDTG